MKKIVGYALAAFAVASTSLLARADARFERTLNVSASSTLHVMTGAGDIRLAQSSSRTIHIVGVVKRGCGWGWGGQRSSDADIQAIAQNPPIEQTGDIVTVGAHLHDLHCISIDYTIEAPASVMLELNSGSGDVTDDGVGSHARLRTGSGDIRAHGLTGGFTASTGSGNIVIDSGGSGDVRADTGSGDITLRGVAGALRASTGSGNLHLGGNPTSGWYVTTGSGDVELHPGQAGFTLDAHTGSGDIHFDGAASGASMTEVQSTHHSFHAKVRGGGATIEVHTGSGNVHVD